MYIGIPKECRPFEYRVGLSPAAVDILTQQGHQVFVEHDAGIGAAFRDQDYEKNGARIAYAPEEIFARGDMVVKIARPIKEEIEWMQDGAILAGFLHLASSSQDQIDLLLKKKVTSISYTQITDASGGLPVLRPLSLLGGSMLAQISARLLQNDYGGRGISLSGLPGVPPAEVVIIGGGVFGSSAARHLLAAGAHVTVIDRSTAALERIDERCPGAITLISTRRNIERAVAYADVLIGAVLMRGQRAPIVITRDMIRSMKPRAVVIDVSIDEGGCIETSRPTTHEHPTYVEEGVIHYCVPNISSVVARSACHVLVNAAMPYIQEIANNGIEAAMKNPFIQAAVNTHDGKLLNLLRLTAEVK
jgi:alanine dehydrogenase